MCFTGVKPTPKERTCIKKLGISEVCKGFQGVGGGGGGGAHEVELCQRARPRLPNVYEWCCLGHGCRNPTKQTQVVIAVFSDSFCHSGSDCTRNLFKLCS